MISKIAFWCLIVGSGFGLLSVLLSLLSGATIDWMTLLLSLLNIVVAMIYVKPDIEADERLKK